MTGKSNDEIIIREAAPADIDIIARLRVELLIEIGNCPSKKEDAEELFDAVRYYFKDKLQSDECKVFIAVHKKEIIATSALIRFIKPPTAGNLTGLDGHVLNMYTVTKWRGQGLAEKLLNQIISYARAKGYKRLWLDAVPEAKPLYEKVGFKVNHQTSTSRANLDMEMFLD